MSDNYEELTGEELQRWLEREPPLRCAACGRGAWDEGAEGTRCDFPQPNGHRCPGRFLAVEEQSHEG